jgi:FkbH-like protein
MGGTEVGEQNPLAAAIDAFGAPSTLSVTPTDLRRVLIIGACFVDAWAETFAIQPDGVACDRLHFSALPEQPPHDIGEYDYQVVAIPTRAILPEPEYFRLNFADTESYARLFEDSCRRMDLFLAYAMRFNTQSNILSFVCNLFVPMANSAGRLLPRRDLRNPVYFVESLNDKLASLIQTYQNTYLLDVDAISARIGRRYIQDDFITALSHGSIFDDYGYDQDQLRIQPPAPLTTTYTRRREEFLDKVWGELRASYRTAKQIDVVKLVIVDLDDTLWRGVIGDAESIDQIDTEGWPLGVVETLQFLRCRGVILAIVSQNSEELVRRLWPDLFKGRLELEDFAFVRINWEPKAQKIAEIIQLASLTPASVVFVDDNPVEREAVRSALPGIRVLGDDLYALRRVLLWSSETQVASITDESSRRTELVQQQALRQAEQLSLSREEFLYSLDVSVNRVNVNSSSDQNFQRVLELINKTNQFNTTGRRWEFSQLADWLSSGRQVSAFYVEDKYSKYGLVGVVLYEAGRIEQFVMSCRVLGMEVEIGILSSILFDLRKLEATHVCAEIVETNANLPCRDVYERAGFLPNEGGWVSRDPIWSPTHITLT